VLPSGRRSAAGLYRLAEEKAVGLLGANGSELWEGSARNSDIAASSMVGMAVSVETGAHDESAEGLAVVCATSFAFT
jgi:hypothetical protein